MKEGRIDPSQSEGLLRDSKAAYENEVRNAMIARVSQMTGDAASASKESSLENDVEGKVPVSTSVIPPGAFASSEWAAATQRMRGRSVTLRAKLSGGRISEEEFGKARAESAAIFDADMEQVCHS